MQTARLIAATLVLTFLGPAVCSAAINQTLEGELQGLADDVLEVLEKDRVLSGQKLRLDRVSSSGMPDANFDLFIESTIEELLGDALDANSRLLLKVEYSFIESESKANGGNRIVQLSAKILDKGRPVKLRLREATDDQILREVNNTSDIARVLGVTVAPPDTEDYQERLQAALAAVERPDFELRDRTQVAAPGEASYAVELRNRSGGTGPATAVVPSNENGLAFAGIDLGDTYEIALFNYDENADAVAKVEVDGLDVANAFNADRGDADPLLPGYFVPRASGGRPGVHVIPGWFHTAKPGDDNVFEFVVNRLGHGAASSLKVIGKTGVVTVRFFEATSPNEQPRGRAFGETGVGKPRKQDYTTVTAQVSSEPSAIVSIRYSRSPERPAAID